MISARPCRVWVDMVFASFRDQSRHSATVRDLTSFYENDSTSYIHNFLASALEMQATNPRLRPCRIILTPQLAIEIYLRKLELLTTTNCASCSEKTRLLLRGQSVPISLQYHVSAKTIRDIWNRRTWMFATSSLWRRESSQSITATQVGHHFMTQA